MWEGVKRLGERETHDPDAGQSGVRRTPDGRLTDHDWLFALKHNLYASAALAHCADMNPRFGPKLTDLYREPGLST